MAIDLTLEYATTAWGNRTNTTVAAPANLSDGDFMLAGLNLFANVAVTPPTGWTSIYRLNNANGTFLEVFYKRASSEGSSWTWTHSNTSTAAFVKRFTGVVASGDPEDCAGDEEIREDWPTSITNAAISTATDGAAVCQVLAGQDTTAWSGETLTERIDIGRIALCCDIQASAGSSGNKSATANAADSLTAVLLALTPAAGLIGSVCWGHLTGVVEDSTRTFLNNWTGTGAISGSGDSEYISLDSSEYMESEAWNLGSGTAFITRDKYASGEGVPTIKYKTGADQTNCELDSWHDYSNSFSCLGWAKIRLEN